jgi:hypothetical protein
MSSKSLEEYAKEFGVKEINTVGIKPQPWEGKPPISQRYPVETEPTTPGYTHETSRPIPVPEKLATYSKGYSGKDQARFVNRHKSLFRDLWRMEDDEHVTIKTNRGDAIYLVNQMKDYGIRFRDITISSFTIATLSGFDHSSLSLESMISLWKEK